MIHELKMTHHLMTCTPVLQNLCHPLMWEHDTAAKTNCANLVSAAEQRQTHCGCVHEPCVQNLELHGLAHVRRLHMRHVACSGAPKHIGELHLPGELCGYARRRLISAGQHSLCSLRSSHCTSCEFPTRKADGLRSWHIGLCTHDSAGTQVLRRVVMRACPCKHFKGTDAQESHGANNMWCSC